MRKREESIEAEMLKRRRKKTRIMAKEYKGNKIRIGEENSDGRTLSRRKEERKEMRPGGQREGDWKERE